MMKLLGSSSSIEGIKQVISQYWYGATISLIPAGEKIWDVANLNGVRPGYRVIQKKGRYRFEEAPRENGRRPKVWTRKALGLPARFGYADDPDAVDFITGKTPVEMGIKMKKARAHRATGTKPTVARFYRDPDTIDMFAGSPRRNPNREQERKWLIEMGKRLKKEGVALAKRDKEMQKRGTWSSVMRDQMRDNPRRRPNPTRIDAVMAARRFGHPVVWLQSYGWCAAVPAGDLKPGDIMTWNFGSHSVVKSIRPVGKASVEIVETATSIGHDYVRRFMKNRLIGIHKPKDMFRPNPRRRKNNERRKRLSNPPRPVGWGTGTKYRFSPLGSGNDNQVRIFCTSALPSEYMPPPWVYGTVVGLMVGTRTKGQAESLAKWFVAQPAWAWAEAMKTKKGSWYVAARAWDSVHQALKNVTPF